MKVICDTNSITALRLGNQQVLEALEQASTVYLSVIVMGELLYGFAKGSKEKENLNFLKKFINKPTVEVLPVDEETARVYSQLRVDLSRIGKPIPTNDLWIASQAIEHGAVLLSNDLHFNSITGLRRQQF
jgi:tRNA(fMet)-specific endonuclease VapC